MIYTFINHELSQRVIVNEACLNIKVNRFHLLAFDNRDSMKRVNFMKTVKAGKVLLILLILIALNGCAGKDKTKEIVWYIEQGSESWIDSEETYKAISNERIDAVNERLKEMKTGLKLVIKQYPRPESLEGFSLNNQKKLVSNIISKDENVDIVPFNQTYISALEPLDTLFDTKEGKDLSQYYSQNQLDTEKLNNQIYLVPKIVYPLETFYLFINQDYYQAHKEAIDHVIHQPLEVLKYFNENYQNKKDWILSQRFNLETYIADKYQNINNTGLFIRKKDHKVVNPYEEPYILDTIKLISDMRWKGFTGADLRQEDLNDIISKDQVVMDGSRGFTQRLKQKEKDVRLDMTKEYYAYVSGFSMLKDSKQKEDAFRLMAILNTDKECSTILQFGTKPERNASGKIIDHAHYTNSSWNNFGNNIIIESSENEVDNKLDYFKKLEEGANITKEELLPSFFDLSNVSDKLDQFDNIRMATADGDADVIGCIACNKGDTVKDTDTLMKDVEEVNQKLKNAGIDQVIQELQKQLDEWLQNETGN